MIGLGLRQPHYRQLLDSDAAVDRARAGPAPSFLEVHSENFFAAGGAAQAVLRQARERWPISLHGVGLALGSAAGLDPWHLDQLASLVQRVQPQWVSDHAAFARAPLHHGGPVVHANDLLPVAFTDEALAIMAANVSRVQDRLQRPILVENLSAYIAWADDTLAEAEFFNALVQRTGCGLLLDLNNLVVNALNAGADPVAQACAYVDAIHAPAVAEIHLAGYHDDGQIVIDDHGSRVHAPVWQVYRHALQRLGAVPTLIEWDTDVPPLQVLLDEMQLARQAMDDVLGAAAADADARVLSP